MPLPSSEVLSCDTPTLTVTQCLSPNNDQLDYQYCSNGDGTFKTECTCSIIYARTPCGAFSDGFNYTSSLLATLFSVLLVFIAAIKLAGFAGEDG